MTNKKRIINLNYIIEYIKNYLTNNKHIITINKTNTDISQIITDIETMSSIEDIKKYIINNKHNITINNTTINISTIIADIEHMTDIEQMKSIEDIDPRQRNIYHDKEKMKPSAAKIYHYELYA